MLLRPLYALTKFQTLYDEVMNILNNVQFEKNQIILQGLESDPDNWVAGVGSIEELEEKQEKKYKVINPKLKGSYLEEIINQHNGYRTRIMIMPPRQCYSIHADPSKRIHIPIVTNDQCWMIWPKSEACYQLDIKRVYLADTTMPHTFINGGLENRIHIVMCVPS